MEFSLAYINRFHTVFHKIIVFLYIIKYNFHLLNLFTFVLLYGKFYLQPFRYKRNEKTKKLLALALTALTISSLNVLTVHA